MKQLILFIFITVLANRASAQCIAPTNQPTKLTLKEGLKTISGSFLAAGIGTHMADAYLVLISKSDQLDKPPIDNQQYKVGDTTGNAKVVSISSETKFSATNLEDGIPYHVFVYSYRTAGPCYNLISPLVKSATPVLSDTPPQDPEPPKGEKTSKLQPLMDFNFAGKKNTWSNLTPVIFYGWSVSSSAKFQKKGKTEKVRFWDNTFQVGPYIGSTISAKDSTSFLPTLMLPGNAGIQMNYFMTFGNEKKFSVVFAPLNLGLKVISGYSDSTISLAQHSIRHFIGFRYAEFITVSVQYTKGWHNLTSVSNENFEKLFKTTDDKVSYWNVGLTTRLSEDLFPDGSKTPVYLNVNWRSFVNPTGKFGLPNAKIITVGIATNINLKSGSYSGGLPKHPF
jgi:hypothetical protein